MTEQLLKCPFCGGEVKLMAIAGEPFPPTYEVELDKITSNSDDICYIHCPTCGVNWHKEVRIESFPLDTIKAWNTRTPVKQVLERLEEVGGLKIKVIGGRCNGKTLQLGYRKGIENAIEIVKEGLMK